MPCMLIRCQCPSKLAIIAIVLAAIGSGFAALLGIQVALSYYPIYNMLFLNHATVNSGY